MKITKLIKIKNYLSASSYSSSKLLSLLYYFYAV
uniref:Uncharacterized protein n=1 Tax=Siphoviridae sp. ctg4a4 TaxID=2825602 RepID=A0A8S5V5R7_9CAUD|nr:MAG TPA: hypothetical protein [Siphoviridae sp. ctg4a4]